MSNNNTYVVFVVGDTYLPGVVALKSVSAGRF